MDQIAAVFKDPSKIFGIIEKGYRVTVIGKSVYLHGLGIERAGNEDEHELGSIPRRLYFIFDNPSMERTGENLGRINADLDEVNVTYEVCPEHPKIMARWIKMKVELKYPYECYIYVPGDLGVDGPSVEVGDSEFRDIVLTSRDEGKFVSYIPLHTRTIEIYKGWLIDSGNASSTIDRMVLYIQDESLSKPMGAILHI